jgi:hypothetical protein
LVGNLKGTDHLGELGIDGKMALTWILKKQVVDYCEHNNEPTSYIK